MWALRYFMFQQHSSALARSSCFFLLCEFAWSWAGVGPPGLQVLLCCRPGHLCQRFHLIHCLVCLLWCGARVGGQRWRATQLQSSCDCMCCRCCASPVIHGALCVWNMAESGEVHCLILPFFLLCNAIGGMCAAHVVSSQQQRHS